VEFGSGGRIRYADLLLLRCGDTPSWCG